MNTIKSTSPRPSQCVLSFYVVPDRNVISLPVVAPWLTATHSRNAAAEWHESMTREHPLLVRVVGAALGELRTEANTIGLRKVSVAVGAEKAVLNLLRDLLVEREDDVILYSQHPAPVRLLLFRLLLQKRLPVIIDQAACVRRTYNLAVAISLQSTVASVPLHVATHAIGGGPVYPMPGEGEIEGAFSDGQWAHVEKHLISELDLTAYLYCRLAGVESSQFRSVRSADPQ